jgi:hypothetical protein
LAWRRPTSVAGTAPEAVPAVDRVRFLARHAIGMLWLLAGIAVVAAGAEVWRYVLLSQSRFGALSGDVLSTSDTLVHTFAILAVAIGVITAALMVWWLYVARKAGEEVAGYRPARTDREFFAGLLVPGVNLVVAGSVLAELEHAAQRGDAGGRPKPSRLLVWWWVTWAVGGLLTAVTVIWRFRSGVQAHADGIVLAALTDLGAAAVAVLTVLMVRRLVRLLAPLDVASIQLMRVVQVRNAPEPPLRATRNWGSVR